MKTQTDTLFAAITGGVMSSIAYLLGGVDNLVNALAVFMIFDYVTGLMSAYYTDSVNSFKAYKGLAKKSGMISFVVIANQLDIITGGSGFLRDAMIMILIGTEGISIVENGKKMGIQPPGVLTETLNKFMGKGKPGDETPKE